MAASWLMTCRATLIGWGAIEGESLTDTGRDLLAAIAKAAGSAAPQSADDKTNG
jgi:hypothetical protein